MPLSPSRSSSLSSSPSPPWKISDLAAAVKEIYEVVKENRDGEVASYIPQLAKVDPDLCGVSLCAVSSAHDTSKGNINSNGNKDGGKGSLHSFGHHKNRFCIQSGSKPFTYCVARMLRGRNVVHRYVGYEPSGRAFNDYTLNRDGRPFNPFVNAGAIMTTSLICPDHSEPADRYDTIIKHFRNFAGSDGIERHIGFDVAVYMSEDAHADRNTALAYFMRENNCYEGNFTKEKMLEHLKLYLQLCSTTMDCNTLAVMAGTLANHGINPLTGESVIDPRVVKDCLCLMFQCGMYDYSGQFAFEVGLPAKSGVSGCLCVIIPGVAGLAIYSPRLDRYGNCIRGVDFLRHLTQVSQHQYHVFHNLSKWCSENKEYAIEKAASDEEENTAESVEHSECQ